MSKVAVNNFPKTMSIELLQQPHNSCENGLQLNIMELNRLLNLLDKPIVDILSELDRDNSGCLTQKDNRVEMRSLSNSNSCGSNFSDAARVTKDLDHLLNSLSQYQLNQASPNVFDQNSSYNGSEYLFSGQLDYNSSIVENSNYNRINSSPLNYCKDKSSTSLSKQSPTQNLTCMYCHELILDNGISAIGGYWHQNHFICQGCEARLESAVYYEHDELPYCETCHINLFTDKCAYCGEAILDSSLSALGQHWHPEHFFCSSCQGPFEDSGFHEHQGRPFCSECFFELFGHRCSGCQIPITSTFLSAMGKKWHEECFVCKECHSPFGQFTYFEINGDPYCEQHYHIKMGTICGSCSKPIVGSLVNALGRKFHVECFKCDYCMKSLAKGSFKEFKGRPFCTICFAKLCP